MVTLEIRFSPFPREWFYFVSVLVLFLFFFFFDCLRLSLWSAWNVNLRYSHIFSEPFPGHACSLSNFSYICSYFLNVLIFNVRLPKRKKWRVRKGHWPFKSLEVTLAWRGGACNNKRRCFFIWSEVEISSQSIDPWYLENSIFFAQVGCHSYVKLLQEHVHSCQPCGWGWRICNCCSAKTWNWLKLIATIIQVLPWKLQAFNRRQSFKIITSEDSASATVV